MAWARVICEVCYGRWGDKESTLRLSVSPGLFRCISVLRGTMLVITGPSYNPVHSIIQPMPLIIARRSDQICCLHRRSLDTPSEAPGSALWKSHPLAPCLLLSEVCDFPLHSPFQLFFLLTLTLFAYIYLNFSPSVLLICWLSPAFPGSVTSLE